VTATDRDEAARVSAGEVSLCEGGVSKSFWQAEFVRVECTLSLPSVYIADFRAGCSNSRAARMLLS
jgi:hypothetical protein